MTQENYYINGIYHELRNEHFQTEQSYTEAVKQNPDSLPARFSLAIFLAKMGKYEQARKELEIVLKQDNSISDGHYYMGVVALNLNNPVLAQKEFSVIENIPKYASISPYMQGLLCTKRKDYKKALEYFEKSISVDHKATASLEAKAIAHRKLGNKSHAFEAGRILLENDSINYIMFSEKYFLTRKNSDKSALKHLLRDDPELYVELAIKYAALNLYTEAIDVLSMYMQDWQISGSYPLVYYYAGYYYGKLSEYNKSLNMYYKASKCSTDYVFPNRLESFNVLKDALNKTQSDANAYYYLGNLYFSKVWLESAVDNWQQSIKLNPSFVLAYRNIALAYWKVNKDTKTAIKYYELALKCTSKTDFRLYYELDILYEQCAMTKKRKMLFESVPEQILKTRTDLIQRQAGFFTDTGKYEEAISLLLNNRFAMPERVSITKTIYNKAYMNLGKRYLAKKNYKKALECFNDMLKYPKNLGVGRKSITDDAQAWEMIAQTYRKMKKNSLAHKAEQMAARKSDLKGFDWLKIDKSGYILKNGVMETLFYS
ncbi:MAG: hypothetical protein A2252_11700 [Elusimicrobia bacterium RIFOXYA2_FULL_39_19]|nr:MAG: hypothetical protein A2252_11700 [Elusimicrobia bacterium RIFOXYA2_FULL_39_19]